MESVLEIVIGMYIFLCTYLLLSPVEVVNTLLVMLMSKFAVVMQLDIDYRQVKIW